MSSLFNLPTSDSIPDPSSATDRITLEEVAPRSSSLDGAVTIEFTSSPSRWYSPSDSYLVIGCDVFSTLHTAAVGGRSPSRLRGKLLPLRPEPPVWCLRKAPVPPSSPRSLSRSTVCSWALSATRRKSAVCCRSLRSPTTMLRRLVQSELLQTDAYERARNTFGVTDSNDANRSAFEIMYRPPLGFLRTMKAFPGARITLTFNIAPEYGSRVLTDIDDTGTLTVLGKDVAAPTAATDHKVKLTSMKYYAAMMTPLNNPSIPSQVLVPMYEIASSAHQLSAGLTASQLQTISFNVPASTFKIGIGVQVADAGTGIVTAKKDMARFHFPKVQHLSVNYAGYQGGSGAYTSARNSPERPYTDFCQSTLAAQQGRAASVDMIAWSEAPLYLFRFAKPANDVSSNATVRISFTETLAEGVNIFCFAYYQSTAAISYDNSGMVTGAEYAYAS